MHRINLKLGLVVKLHLVAVPVRVPDKFDVLALSGTMEAIITGSPSTNVIWEQLEGTPVTFTTPLNQLSIGFTTTDYEYKLFKCTTNPNTDVERSAVGHFYHYPVDTLNIQRTSSKFHTLRERSEQPKIDIDPGLGVSQYFPRVAVKIEQNTSNHTRFKITKGSDVKITNIKITASNDGINYIIISDGVPNRLTFADLNYEFLEFEVTTFNYGILKKKIFTFNNISSITSKKSGATDLAEINDLTARFTSMFAAIFAFSCSSLSANSFSS